VIKRNQKKSKKEVLIFHQINKLMGHLSNTLILPFGRCPKIPTFRSKSLLYLFAGIVKNIQDHSCAGCAKRPRDFATSNDREPCFTGVYKPFG
jgi:hypothetical protein